MSVIQRKSGTIIGDPVVTIDRGTLLVTADENTEGPVVPAMSNLSTPVSLVRAADSVFIHSVFELTGQKDGLKLG